MNTEAVQNERVGMVPNPHQRTIYALKGPVSSRVAELREQFGRGDGTAIPAEPPPVNSETIIARATVERDRAAGRSAELERQVWAVTTNRDMLAEERDAAIRERDAARFQADKYWEDARYWRHEAGRRPCLQRLRAWLAHT